MANRGVFWYSIDQGEGVGEQDDGIPVLTWASWLMVGLTYVHESYKMEPEVTEEVA